MNDPRRPIIGLAMVAGLSLAIAACGGSSASQDNGGASDGGSGGSSGANPSVAIDLGGGGDVPDSFEDSLTPPNSNYQSSISTPDGAMVTFTSTSSVDELKSFYDAAIAALGGSDIFKMDAGGGFSWAWGEGDAGGLIVVVPNTDGGGNLVSVTYGTST